MGHGYPIILSVAGKRCVVVGHGREADEKSAGLREAGAVVVRSEWWDERLLDGAFMVVSAGPDREINAAVFDACERRGVLVCSIDDPAHCRFTYASVHRQGDLIIAISTSGSCPALAVRLRERFQREFGPEYATFLEICRGLRARLARLVPAFLERKAIWYGIVDSPALDLIRAGKTREAEAAIESLLPPEEPPR
jgi:precorrin-2 dehydrogenase/sirohydrochlorin ferrochelatase